MGIEYYVACEACHEYAELDKFYACLGRGYGERVKTHVARTIASVRDRHWARAGVLVAFAGVHRGHALIVFHEHDEMADRVLPHRETADAKPWKMTMELPRDAVLEKIEKEAK